MRFEGSVVIERPVAEVFAFLTDVERLPLWVAEFESAQRTSEGPVGPGATWVGVAHVFGRRLESDHEVTLFEPDRRYGYRTTTSPVPGHIEYGFEPVPEGTRVTITAEVETRGFLRLAGPMLRRAGARMYQDSLGTLKDLLEERA